MWSVYMLLPIITTCISRRVPLDFSWPFAASSCPSVSRVLNSQGPSAFHWPKTYLFVWTSAFLRVAWFLQTVSSSKFFLFGEGGSMFNCMDHCVKLSLSTFILALESSESNHLKCTMHCSTFVAYGITIILLSWSALPKDSLPVYIEMSSWFPYIQ